VIKVSSLAMLAGVVAFIACGDDKSTGVSSEVEILELRVEEITSTRAVVRFATSAPTTCEAEYGTAPNALNQSAFDPSMGGTLFAIDHNVPIEDLTPGTTYYYRARASTADERTFLSGIQEFTTLAAPALTSVNVALITTGSQVTQVSSNFGGASNDATWGANNAFDGLMSTEWATNGDGDGASVSLDFGSERTIEGFGFRSREMPDGSSIILAVRLIFEPGTIERGPFSTPDPAEFYRFEFNESIVVRSVLIEAVETTGGNSGAKEIQFFEVQ
jgi:hypothetical protein